jgi:hypothetical protein
MPPLLKRVTPETPRSVTLALRVTEAEKAQVEDLADGSLMSVSELIRAALNAYAARTELTSRIVVGPEAEAMFPSARRKQDRHRLN